MEHSKSQFNKLYFEYYAKYSLMFSYDKKFQFLQKAESPDWQSSKLNIGVEVTRAIAKDVCLAYDIIMEYFGKGFDDSLYDYNNDTIADDCIDGNIRQVSLDDIANIHNLKKVYLQKTEKLNKNYIRYSKNFLYMFTFRTMDESEVSQCFDIDLSIYEVNYDYCFVNCFDRLYICSFIDKTIIKSIDVSSNSLSKIKKRAYRKSKI